MNMNQSVQLSWLRDISGRFAAAGGGGRLGLAIASDADVVVVIGTLGGAAWGTASHAARASGPASRAATASRISAR